MSWYGCHNLLSLRMLRPSRYSNDESIRHGVTRLQIIVFFAVLNLLNLTYNAFIIEMFQKLNVSIFVLEDANKGAGDTLFALQGGRNGGKAIYYFGRIKDA